MLLNNLTYLYIQGYDMSSFSWTYPVAETLNLQLGGSFIKPNRLFVHQSYHIGKKL
jgi:hypothetical protein